MTPLQKESEWEKEFDKEFVQQPNWRIDRWTVPFVNVQASVLKSFIRELLSNREKEIAEEVEKYALYCQKESAEQLGRENVMLAYDMDSRQVAAKQILQILKH